MSHVGKRLTGKEHRGGYQEIWALRDVSFELEEGKALGVIGRNGAGKSTLLKILTRITTPTEGTAAIRGRVGSLLEVGTGFHPELTGRENIFLNGAILGMKRREIQAKLPEIAEFSGVEKFLDTPVKRYSSGMHVRLAFSVAAHFEPEIMLVDEVLSVGDAEFQARCLGRMEDINTTGAPSSSCRTRSRPLRSSATACSDRRGPHRSRRAERGGGRALSPVRNRDELHPDMVGRGGAGRRSRAPALGARRAPGRRDGGLRGRARARGRRDELQRAATRAAAVGEDQVVRWADRIQRDGRGPKVARACAARRLRDDRLDPWQLPERGSRHGRRRRLLDRLAQAPPPRVDPRGGLVPRPGPARGRFLRGTFTGQWRGVVRPLLDWTTEEI